MAWVKGVVKSLLDIDCVGSGSMVVGAATADALFRGAVVESLAG
jgi:hypothetical protein